MNVNDNHGDDDGDRAQDETCMLSHSYSRQGTPKCAIHIYSIWFIVIKFLWIFKPVVTLLMIVFDYRDIDVEL